MIAGTQYRLSPSDMDLVLALVRGGTLASAAQHLQVDSSTVFRALQRLEKHLGQTLFERSRSGYLPGEQALTLARHAERMEVEMEAARTALAGTTGQASGTVRLTTTDSLLSGILLPALQRVAARHPGLDFELSATNQLANLSRREADLALRPSRKPPEHLVGKKLGVMQYAIYAAPAYLKQHAASLALDQHQWLGVDDFVPEHPSVQWRQKHLPRTRPRYRCNSILGAADGVRAGLGISILPTFLVKPFDGLAALSEPLPECSSELWLLTHPESRHLRRVSTMFRELGDEIVLG